MMAVTFTKALVALLPFAFATAVPTRRDGTALYKIHPVANSTLCLGSDFPSDGQPVILLECDEYTPGFTNVWSIEQGDNLGVIIGGNSPYCLDAGSTPGNNGLVHTWTCFPGLQQQHWYYTSDQHLAITGGNQCLDSGSADGSHGVSAADQVQTYQCTGGNTNQMWELELVQ